MIRQGAGGRLSQGAVVAGLVAALFTPARANAQSVSASQVGHLTLGHAQSPWPAPTGKFERGAWVKALPRGLSRLGALRFPGTIAGPPVLLANGEMVATINESDLAVMGTDGKLRFQRSLDEEVLQGPIADAAGGFVVLTPTRFLCFDRQGKQTGVFRFRRSLGRGTSAPMPTPWGSYLINHPSARTFVELSRTGALLGRSTYRAFGLMGLTWAGRQLIALGNKGRLLRYGPTGFSPIGRVNTPKRLSWTAQIFAKNDHELVVLGEAQGVFLVDIRTKRTRLLAKARRGRPNALASINSSGLLAIRLSDGELMQLQTGETPNLRTLHLPQANSGGFGMGRYSETQLIQDDAGSVVTLSPTGQLSLVAGGRVKESHPVSCPWPLSVMAAGKEVLVPCRDGKVLRFGKK